MTDENTAIEVVSKGLTIITRRMRILIDDAEYVGLIGVPYRILVSPGDHQVSIAKVHGGVIRPRFISVSVNVGAGETRQLRYRASWWNPLPGQLDVVTHAAPLPKAVLLARR